MIRIRLWGIMHCPNNGLQCHPSELYSSDKLPSAQLEDKDMSRILWVPRWTFKWAWCLETRATGPKPLSSILRWVTCLLKLRFLTYEVKTTASSTVGCDMRINEATDLSSSLVAQIIKNPPAVQETQEGRSPGAGNGYPLQWSCLENPMDTGAWQVQSMGLQVSDMT